MNGLLQPFSLRRRPAARAGLRRGYLIGLILALALLDVGAVWAQEGSSIPREFRGRESWIARGILDGNLIETNFRNHGELSRWDDLPWGVWPRGIGGRHVDGVGVMVAGRVPGERVKWGLADTDTLVNPVILTYRDAGKRLSPSGNLWGWLPVNGFHNPDRINALGQREPIPALSDDPSSWPTFWPDRLDNPDDPGWAGVWNGFFGRGVRNADLESYYVIDDFSDREYAIDSETGQPNSQYGVFYPSPSDSTIGGLGLQTQVRIFQWANVLAEDVMFILYRISNVGETEYAVQNETLAGPDLNTTGLYFTQIMDYGLGNEEGDENAAFDAQQDVVFGFDQDGIGQRTDGTLYDLGYTGFAFLESPSRPADGRDNDEDGITDEQRFGGPGILIEGQDAIRAYVESNYNMTDFVRFNGPLESRPAYEAGVWWTGDENLDWVGFEDDNGNGQYDVGEFVNSDVGRDGLGPFDFGYPGPDTGEADGMPSIGEPNFDELDIDESDQIGLTGYDLNNRPFYENGDNLRDDTWLFDRILNFAEPNITIGTPANEEAADVEPFLLFTSGPVGLGLNETDFFSTAWLFGEDEQDFFRNRRTVQSIYDADYNFAQPPVTPTLTAVAGDGRVVLAWDTLALASFDRFSQSFDFEGFKLYKGTDPLLSDARLISDANGTPTFYRPIAQWDLDNDISGTVPVLDGQAIYDLGDNAGLSFFYIDDDVVNGKTYYYALVAYDRGIGDLAAGKLEIDPQENVFNISVDLAGNVTGVSQNAAIVVPRPKPAGYMEGGANEDLSRPTSGIGTGSIAVNIVSDELVKPDHVYQVRFFSEPIDVPGLDLYTTAAYEVVDITSGETKVARTALTDVTPLIDGFVVEFENYEFIPGTTEFDETQLGYQANAGTANELYSLDPRTLDGYSTNWLAQVRADTTTAAVQTADTYELRWVNEADSLYTPPRLFGFLREPIPIFGVNVSQQQTTDLLVEDRNDTGTFDPGDDLIILERDPETGQREFRHRVRFTLPPGETSSTPPAPGSVLRITPQREFATGDLFQFTVDPAGIDAELAESELDDIAVVPNPYVGASAFEPRSQITGRGERRIQFINLPRQCTIRIYNLRGELIQTLTQDAAGSNGAMFWDLRTSGGQDLAYGVYVYHVDAPGIGEHIGKFAVVK